MVAIDRRGLHDVLIGSPKRPQLRDWGTPTGGGLPPGIFTSTMTTTTKRVVHHFPMFSIGRKVHIDRMGGVA